MDFFRFNRKKRKTPDHRSLYRPVLDCLEDRCLFSAGFAQVNLASDVPGLARVTDPDLVNPWGVSFSPTGPFWFAENGSSVSDLLDGRGQPLPLVVTVPSAGLLDSAPTGTVFNGGAGFAISANGVAAPSRFLFATKDGTISGWTALVDPTRAFLVVDNSPVGAVYTGLTLAADPTGHSFLYAADFSRGSVDVFDQQFRPVVRPGSFQDPNLPDGYAPFNIQNINNLLFVTYAQQDEDHHDDVAGAGHGFVDVYDPEGSLVRRFASQGELDSPWGLALARADFGPFGGALLVGNNGDGRMSAYDARSGAFLGQLADDSGAPIVLPNLWALTFGNGHAGGDAHTLFFAAGVDYDLHGLFGAIQAPEQRGADTAGSGVFDPQAPDEPGDYPLPPSRGPAFQANADRSVFVVELLPLREASLALVPTLSLVSGPSTWSEIFVPIVLTGGCSSSGLILTATPTSQLGTQALAWENVESGQGAHDNMALNAFLGWNPLANDPCEENREHRLGSSLDALGAGSSAAAAINVDGKERVAASYIQRIEPPPSQEHGPHFLPPSGQADMELSEVASEGCWESAEQPAREHKAAGTRDGGRWTKLMNRTLVLSIPMILAYWLTHKLRSCQPSGIALGPGKPLRDHFRRPTQRKCSLSHRGGGHAASFWRFGRRLDSVPNKAGPERTSHPPH
jgi:uncharacterized protein (TIGR03118 family)